MYEEGFFGCKHCYYDKWLYVTDLFLNEGRRFVLVWMEGGDPSTDEMMRWKVTEH